MSIITLNFETLALIVVALFALGGFLRGWWREAITTVALVLLTIFLTQPELADKIIQFINNIIEIIWNLVSGVFGAIFGGAEATAAAETTPPIVLDPSDRSMYVIILIIVILISYFLSKVTLGGRTMSVDSRIFGGILGAINGYLAVNLFIEFIVGRFFPDTGLTAQSAAPESLTIAVTGVPSESAFADSPYVLILGLGVIVLALVLANRVSRKGKREPWGYQKPKGAAKEGAEKK